MKALVTYYSRTGNTEKLARAIYDAIHVEKELCPIPELEKIEGYDVIFVGFPVQAHSVPAKALPFFKKLTAGQKIALFTTHGSLRGGRLPKQALEHASSISGGAKILGTFGVRGRVDATVLEGLSRQIEHQAWAEEAQGAQGHPDEADLADGKTFAREILAKVGR